MDGTRHKLLASSRRTLDEDWEVAARSPQGQTFQHHHLGRHSEHAVERRVGGTAQAGGDDPVRRSSRWYPYAGDLSDAGGQGSQVVSPLDDVVLGSGADCRQTDIGGIGGRQKDRRGGWERSSLALEQAHAGRVREDVVDEEHVEAPLLEPSLPIGCSASDGDMVSMVLEGMPNDHSMAGIVFDQQDFHGSL